MHAPDPDADPITPALLLRAYAAGMFPMAEDAEDEHCTGSTRASAAFSRSTG